MQRSIHRSLMDMNNRLCGTWQRATHNNVHFLAPHLGSIEHTQLGLIRRHTWSLIAKPPLNCIPLS